MGFLDKAKNAAKESLDEARRYAEKQKAIDEALGRKIMSIEGSEKGSRVTLYDGGIRFECREAELEPGVRFWDSINSVALEDGEELEKRVTLTRVVLLGFFALAFKKKKGGTKFITVEGDDFLWPMEVGRKQVKDAQKLVMKARALLKQS